MTHYLRQIYWPSSFIRMLCFALCFWILIFQSADSGHAFYHSDEKESKSPFFRKDGKIAWKGGEKIFAVYDNLKHPSANLHQEPILFPRSGKFVPADLLSCDLPLYTIFRHPKTERDLIAELLYANLELRKLFEEYNALQKRVQKLLSDLMSADAASFFSGTPGGNDAELAKLQEKVLAFNETLDETQSVYKEWERLNQKARLIARQAAPLKTDEGDIPLANIGSLIALRNLSGTSQRLSFRPETYFGDGNFLQDQSDASRQRASSSTRSDSFRNKSGRRFSEGDASPGEGGFLMWLLKVPSKIFRYMVSNKIKSLVAMVFLFLIGYGVLAILRSRRY